MADDIRNTHTDLRAVTVQRRVEVAKEAMRQSESCLWTSTSLYIWLRQVRRQRQFFIAAPIVLGALASFTVLQDVVPAWVVATLSLGASLFPALSDGLNIQTSVNEIARLAAEFKALQDRFRRVANITVLGTAEEAEAALAELMDRMDVVRSASVTPPEKYFEKARLKIEGGHYNFQVDLKAIEAAT